MKNYYCFGFCLLLVLFCIQSQAQKNYLGLKAGISIPNLTSGGSENNEINTGYSSALGPDFALFYEAQFSKRFSLSTQLEYCAEGGKKNGFQALPTPDNLAPYFTYQNRPVPDVVYANFTSKAKMNYLMLSELAKLHLPFGTKSLWSFYIEAGPFAGLLVSAHQVTSGTSDIYADKTMQENITENTQQGPQSFDNKQDIKSDLHKGNFGIEGDLGIALNLKSGKIFLEGGGNYGFLNIQKGTANGKNQIGAGTVRAGYTFSFGK